MRVSMFSVAFYLNFFTASQENSLQNVIVYFCDPVEDTTKAKTMRKQCRDQISAIVIATVMAIVLLIPTPITDMHIARLDTTVQAMNIHIHILTLLMPTMAIMDTIIQPLQLL